MAYLNYFREKYGKENVEQNKAIEKFDKMYVEKERKRKQEEERRKRERERLQTSTQSIKDISQSENPTPEQPNKSPYNNFRDDGLNETSFSTQNKMKPYMDFSNDLENDLNTRINTQKVLGMKDTDIEKDLIPKNDDTIKQRLDEISKKLKPGKEGFAYGIKEGWYEREIQDMLSKENVRKINGLPNKVDEIEKWIENNPELQKEERDTKIEDWLSAGVRGAGSQIKQRVDSYTHALKQPSTYVWAGAITAASIMAAPFTGGASLAGGGALLVTSPLVAGGMSAASKAIAMLGPVAGVRFGMKTGAYDNMAKLEGRSSYIDLVEAGVDKRIAEPLSETVGAVNGLLEFMQLETAFGAIPGVSDLVGNAKKMALNEFTKKAIKVVGSYGVNLGSEVFEEMAQAGVSEMGLELGKYLQDAPDPSTIEGLKVLGKTMTSEDFRDTVLNEGYHALQAMWLTPILSSAGRVSANQSLKGMANITEKMQATKILEQEDNIIRENNKKNMDFILKDNGATDQAIKFVNETLDPQAMAFLASEKTILEDMLQREDITNQDKEKMSDTLEKISTVLSKTMYDEKDKNPDIEYRPTNRIDIEEEILSDGWLDKSNTYNENLYNYNIELYKQAKEYNTADTIKEELKKGTNKAEIINMISKKLPKKSRKPLEVMNIINSVGLVQNEIEMQIIQNQINNILEVQANNIENIKTEPITADIQQETKTNENVVENEGLESSITEDNKESNIISQEESENLAQANVVADNTIQEEVIEEEANKSKDTPLKSDDFKLSDIKRVPVNEVHVDAQKYQFRFDKGNEYGAGKKFDGIDFNEKVADPVLLREDEYGDLYMVNGHHRLWLAVQSGVDEIDAKIISYKDYSVEKARALGAMMNIAQDNASAIDVAKLIKDTGATESEFKAGGVRPNSKIYKDGTALANLNDWIFTQVATKWIPLERAVIIGRELKGNETAQNQIIRDIRNQESKGKSITNDVLTELIAAAKGMAQVEYEEMTLMGLESFTKDLSIERAELVSYVKSQLKSRVSLLKNVSKNKNAAILQELGNTIAVDENVKEMNTADQALFILDKTLNYKGTKINELFNNLAKEYADTDNKASVKKKALNELITLMESGNVLDLINQQVKKADIQDNIEGTQPTFGLGEQEIQAQEDLVGQETMMQLKNLEETKIIADDDAKKGVAFRATGKIVEAIKNNPIFNGLTINYSNESGKVTMSKEELINYGYGHLEETGEKTIYGFYNDGDRTITLNSEATRDTILEEAIHDIQYRLEEIDPSLAVLVDEWESEVREQALQEGITIPEGYELLAQALVYTEYGYASTNPFIANLIAVDDEIVKRFTTLLGSDIAERGFGFVESETAKQDRQLRGKYESYAKRIFNEKYAENTKEAKKARANEIMQDLENSISSEYYQPYTNQYVIVSPSTKDGKYQITYFHPEFGPVSDSQYETTQEVADRLVKDGYFYKTDEVHYQLKSYDRGVVDELYRSAISRGYRTNNSGNGQRISFGLSDNQIIDANFDAKIGNFLASDFDELIKDNKEVLPRVKNDIIENIIASVDKGLDVPNSEVSFIQYLNRFHDISLYNVDSSNTQPRTYTIRYNEKTNKIEFGNEGVDKKAEREFSALDEYDTLEDAIKDYKKSIDLFYGISDNELNEKITPIVKKDFMYMVEMLKDSKDISEKQAIKRIADDILGDYKEFKTNIETYRHKGLNYNFDMKPHYAISYQLKQGLNNQLKAATDTPEFKNWFKDSKVVDESGNPLIVYHGTPATFNSFNLDKVGDRNAYYGKGFYFTTDYATANDYALDISNNIEFQEAVRVAKEKSDIHASYDFWELHSQGKLENATKEDLARYSELRAAAWDEYVIANNHRNELRKQFWTDRASLSYTDEGNIMETYLSIENPFIIDAEGANYDKINPVAWDMAYANNSYRTPYDGMIIKNVIDAASTKRLYPIDVYIAFNPTQIKSLYNNGMFNEYDPNINYQLKETKPIVDVEGFYSNLENAINDKMGKRAKASDLMNMFRKNGVKPEELEWFEISDFLDGKDFVYKNELLDHMREKSIEFTKEDMGNEFASYTLDGGDNYRFNAYVYSNNPEHPFISQAHFGALENVIAHTRYKDREGPNGEAILFIEELQSDWHQKGRQEGYDINAQPILPEGYTIESVNSLWRIYKDNIQVDYVSNHALMMEFGNSTEESAKRYVNTYFSSQGNEYKVADAPLKESVTDFMLKTAIKDAVDGGYDYIAWTTGTQQADRYSLRKVIDELAVLVNPPNKTYEVYAKQNGMTQVHLKDLTEAQLADTLGKEIASKIVEDAKPIYSNFGDVNEPLQLKTYKDLELETGGEFHKKLYDNYIPRMLKKYGKKWGLDLAEIELKNNIENIELYQNELMFYSERDLIFEAQELGLSTTAYENALDGEDYELIFEEQGLLEDAIIEAKVARDMKQMSRQPSIPVTPAMIEDVMTQGQPLFQLKDVPETNGNLLAIHNLSEEQLKNTIKLGGFPFPSIAVVNKEYEHSRYGDISVLFGKDTINPRLNRKNKVYGGDAWTPTFPTINKKISKKAADALYERINNIVPADIRREYRLSLDKDNLDDQINRAGNFVDAYKYNSAMKYAYLKEQGIDIEMPTKEKQYSHEADLLEVLKDKYPVFSNEKYIDFNEAEKIKNDVISDLNSFYGVDLYNADIFGFSQMSRLGEAVYEFSKRGRETVIDYYELTSILDKQINQESFEKWLNDISSGIIEKEGIRNNADYFTPSGNRRKWESLHIEATLDNIVKIMSGKAQKGSDTMFPTFPTFAATVTDNFGSIEEIRQSSDRLVSLDEDSYSEISNQYSEKYMEIIGEMAIPSQPNQFMAMDTIGEAIIESVSKSITKQGIKKVLDSYYGLKYEDSTVDKIIELVKLVKTMPTEYFEAKPQRAVYLNEIAAVIVPDTLSPEVEQMLKDNGIHLIEKYSKEDDTARQKAMDSILRQNDVSFQLKEAKTNTRIKLELRREEEMGNSLIKYYNLLVEGTKKGYAELVIDDKGNAVIDDIGIDKDSRNKGYGTQSIKALAKEHGGVFLAPTDEDNQRLYERLGEEDYYEYGIDQGYGVYFIDGDVSFQLKEADTTTKEFKNWFKDSKVVDEEGKPLKVYHGTQQGGFNKFDINYDTPYMFFTSEYDLASDYGDDYVIQPTDSNVEGVYPVYLSLRNPLVVNANGAYYHNINGLTTEEIAKNALDEIVYDGVIIENVYDNVMGGSYRKPSTVYIAFQRDQIKSVNNQGTWEVNNPNIYYQLKEEPEIRERSWGQTIRDANLTTPWLKELLTSNKFMYEVKHNEDTLLAAAKLLDEKGEEYIEARLLSDIQNDTVLFAASQILTYKYMEDGEQDRAMSMIEKTAEKATSMGQAIQILSVWGRQTPEGMLRHTHKIFSSAMTDKQKAKVSETTKDFKATFNELNKKHIREIDLVGSIDQLNNLSKDELLQEALKTTKGRELVDKYGIEGLLNQEGVSNEDKATLESFSERTDINTQEIVDIVQKHYEDGKGNLKDKLVKGGMNELEADLLSKYVKEDMKNRISQEVTEKTNKLPKKDYERKGIDEQLLEKIAKGEIDEDSLRSYIAEKEGLPIMNKELAEYIYAQGQRINEMEQGRERDIETGKLIQEIMSHVPVSFWEKLKVFRYMNMLLNFKTIGRNLIGNDMFRRLDTFTLNFFGAPIDKVLSMNTKKRTQLFRFGEYQKYQRRGYVEHWEIGFEDALLGINTSDMDSKFELRKTRTFDGGILGKAETAMDIAMRATDKAAAGATFVDALQEQYKLAELNGWEITEELKNLMAERSAMLGAYRTFNDDTALSRMASGIQQKMNIAGFGGEKGQPKEFGLGHVIMPFPRTPSNIAARAVDYSPMGLVVTMLKLYNEADPYTKQRVAVEGVSRALMGTGLIAIGALLARMGVLTGSNPDDDEDIYKLEKAYGLRDFSVNLSAIARHILGGFKDPTAGELRKGDRIASYDWAEPIAMPLAIGADTELGKGDALSLLSTVVRATEAGATALTDQPLLSGIADLFRYGDPIQGLTQTFKRFPTSLTPSLLAHVAQFMDGRDTDPYSFYDDGRQAWNLIANRMPILREGMPQRHTVLGDPKHYTKKEDGLLSRAFNAFLSPAITSKYMPPAEAELLFDLYNATEDADIVPRGPQKSYTIDKVKYTFTPETWEEMSKWLGGRYKEEINRAMNTYMRNWSAEEQADEIKYIITQIKKEAREKVLELGTPNE